jgi:hypothetical protein
MRNCTAAVADMLLGYMRYANVIIRVMCALSDDARMMRG